MRLLKHLRAFSHHKTSKYIKEFMKVGSKSHLSTAYTHKITQQHFFSFWIPNEKWLKGNVYVIQFCFVLSWFFFRKFYGFACSNKECGKPHKKNFIHCDGSTTFCQSSSILIKLPWKVDAKNSSAAVEVLSKAFSLPRDFDAWRRD